jgi:hypothetical protein
MDGPMIPCARGVAVLLHARTIETNRASIQKASHEEKVWESRHLPNDKIKRVET